LLDLEPKALELPPAKIPPRLSEPSSWITTMKTRSMLTMMKKTRRTIPSTLIRLDHPDFSRKGRAIGILACIRDLIELEGKMQVAGHGGEGLLPRRGLPQGA
jgi:hypothetical protein